MREERNYGEGDKMGGRREGTKKITRTTRRKKRSENQATGEKKDGRLWKSERRKKLGREERKGERREREKKR